MALNSSQEYADSYNKAIAEYQDRINNELFGSWVNTTSVTLNSTLVEFYDEVEKGEAHSWIFPEEDNTNESSALNASFGSTILSKRVSLGYLSTPLLTSLRFHPTSFFSPMPQ